MDIFNLFLIFARISAVTIGGGYAMISVVQSEVVDTYKLMEEEEFVDIIAMAQSIPGAIIVNTALFVGYKLADKKGAFACCMGAILPPFIIIYIVAIFFGNFREIHIINSMMMGIRPATVALIGYTFVGMYKAMDKSYMSLFTFVASAMAIVWFDITPIYVILCNIAIGSLMFRGNTNV